MNYDLLRDKKIALLLSGGVDSAVVLHELSSHGLQPDCFYIKIGPEEDEEWGRGYGDGHCPGGPLWLSAQRGGLPP